MSCTTATTTTTALSLLLLLLLSVSTVFTFQSDGQHRRAGSRYFETNLLLPPVREQTRKGGPTAYPQLSELPLKYTNNPKVVSQWCSDNIPQKETFVLGFDVEVSFVCLEPLEKRISVCLSACVW